MSTAPVPPSKPSATAPDIILICIDDLGVTDLGCFGSSFYETPNLDRLAASGMRFTQAYAACPVCSPTRASILTGQYPARVGITQYIGGKAHGKLSDVPYLNFLPKELTTIATALHEANYATWHVGKWHLGGEGSTPTDHGFDCNIAGRDWGCPHQGYWAPWGMPGLPDAPEGTYLTDAITDAAINLIRDRDSTKPYFMNLWHYAVHTPIQAPAELVKKYTDKAKRLGLDRIPAIIPGEHLPCHHKRHLRIERRIIQSDPAYAAMMENLDTNIGRLLAGVERFGNPENTLVVFTSDNGGLSTAEGSPTCNAPYFEGKGWAYEGGTRVSQIASWPTRIAPGTTCATPVISTDFFPTFLAAAQAPARPDDHCDGVDLSPLFAGDQIDRQAIFWHYPHYSNQGGAPACAIRVGPWKLIESFEDGRLELFHLIKDPSERSDLSHQEPDRVRTMHKQLDTWRTSVLAKIPARNPDWKPDTAHLAWAAADV